MKTLIITCLSALLMLNFSACSSNDEIENAPINDKEGVTCTFHSNISPCVNLKNDGFSDFTGTLLSFIKK